MYTVCSHNMVNVNPALDLCHILSPPLIVNRCVVSTAWQPHKWVKGSCFCKIWSLNLAHVESELCIWANEVTPSPSTVNPVHPAGLSSADRWETSSSVSSAAWLTSATPFIGCHRVSFGQDAFPIGWLGCWAPLRLWLVWCRWIPAAVTNQSVLSLNLTMMVDLDYLYCKWSVLRNRSDCWLKWFVTSLHMELSLVPVSRQWEVWFEDEVKQTSRLHLSEPQTSEVICLSNQHHEQNIW